MLDKFVTVKQEDVKLPEEMAEVEYRDADGNLKEGFILPSWNPVCATLDFDWCNGMDWEEPIYPYDLRNRTPAQRLRETYGWRKTKKYGWLCPGCQALLDGKPNPRENEEENDG